MDLSGTYWKSFFFWNSENQAFPEVSLKTRRCSRTHQWICHHFHIILLFNPLPELIFLPPAFILIYVFLNSHHSPPFRFFCFLSFLRKDINVACRPSCSQSKFPFSIVFFLLKLFLSFRLYFLFVFLFFSSCFWLYSVLGYKNLKYQDQRQM